MFCSRAENSVFVIHFLWFFAFDKNTSKTNEMSTINMQKQLVTQKESQSGKAMHESLCTKSVGIFDKNNSKKQKHIKPHSTFSRNLVFPALTNDNIRHFRILSPISKPKITWKRKQLHKRAIIAFLC